MNRIRSIGRLGLLAAWALAAATLRTAPAAITVQDGVPWVYQVSNGGGATILHGPGCGDVTIPAQLDCYPVTRIETNAFYYCYGLTSVTIGNSVTSIGDNAFSGCTGLTSVTIGDSVTSIGYQAFYNCTNLTSVTIPDSVSSIEDWAFSHCSGLTNVTIPDSVTSIRNYAFSQCSGLTSVTIGDSVASIGDHAFYNCTNLTSVTIPDSVTSIGYYAFDACSGLTNMTVGGSVTNIGYGMVTNCSQLATMNVPEAWRSLYVYGEFWSEYAGVPWECTIVYYEPTTPGVTATGVPYAWLEEKAGEALAAAGGDYEAAEKAAAANGRAVWECYVAGLDPGDAEKDFTTEISFADGVPEVSWNPDLNEGGTKSARSYVVEGKSTMADDWDATNSASRFFRVKVGLPKP